MVSLVGGTGKSCAKRRYWSILGAMRRAAIVLASLSPFLLGLCCVTVQGYPLQRYGSERFLADAEITTDNAYLHLFEEYHRLPGRDGWT